MSATLRPIATTIADVLTLSLIVAVTPIHAQRARAAAKPGPEVNAAPTVAALPDGRTDKRPFAFIGVTIVDVETGQLVPDQVVVVNEDHIAATGPSALVQIPEDARIINARGKYLMPGLWDMHVHVWDYSNVFYPLFVATGITGVRDMGQPLGLDSIRKWRSEILAGRRIGPRIVASGAFIETPEDARAIPIGRVIPALRVGSPEEARRLVDSLKAAGADFLKLHSEGMPLAVYRAIADQAKRAKIPFAGHRPGSVSVAEASELGQLSLEHYNLFETPCLSSSHALAAADSTPAARCAAQAAQFRRNGTWLTPTLAIFHSWLGGSSENARFWPASVEENNMRSVLGDDMVQDLLDDGKRLVGSVHRVGLPLLTGTDATPGSRASVHQELAFFVEAGLTPAEALRTATINPAKALKATDSLGTVAVGKRADLVLLDADPLRNITNTTKIRAVVANGRYFDRKTLDAVLTDLEANAKEK